MAALRLNRRTLLKSSLAAAAVGVVDQCGSRLLAGEKSAVDIGSETQLFLDDWVIDRREGLRRTLHQPTKRGLINKADGSDWDRGDVYHGNIVCRDSSGRFHMTYRYTWSDPSVRSLHANIGDDKAHWFRESIAYATSQDGIHWQQPVLDLVEGPTEFVKQDAFPFWVPAGKSKRNNLGCPIDFIYDLHAHGNIADPAKRFLLRVARRNDTHPFAEVVESQMYFAADWPDFVGDRDWKRKLTPIRGGNLSPRGFRTLCGWDHAERAWFATAQDHLHNWIPRGGRDIARMFSPDLVTWKGGQLVLSVAKDESRTPRDWVEYMDLNAYRVGGPKSGAWLGQLNVFHSDRSNSQYKMPGRKDDVCRKGVTEIRLVLSRDAGKTWQRVADKQAWLPHHEQEHGYDRLVFQAQSVRVGDEMWCYYGAWDGDHLTFNRDGSLYEPGFLRTGRTARATMRVDGHLSLDAGQQPGSVLTRPLRFSGDKLVVNLDAPRGRLRAEMQDESGRPIPGFALADCAATSGNGLALAVQWRGDARLGRLAQRAVRLRLEFAHGSLYSFAFR